MWKRSAPSTWSRFLCTRILKRLCHFIMGAFFSSRKVNLGERTSASRAGWTGTRTARIRNALGAEVAGRLQSRRNGARAAQPAPRRNRPRHQSALDLLQLLRLRTLGCTRKLLGRCPGFSPYLVWKVSARTWTGRCWCSARSSTARCRTCPTATR